MCMRGRITTMVILVLGAEAAIQNRIVVALVEDRNAVMLQSGIEFRQCAPAIAFVE